MVPDLFERPYVRELVQILLVQIGFKQVCVQQVCSFCIPVPLALYLIQTNGD